MPASSISAIAASLDHGGGAIPPTGFCGSFVSRQKNSGSIWWCVSTMKLIAVSDRNHRGRNAAGAQGMHLDHSAPAGDDAALGCCAWLAIFIANRLAQAISAGIPMIANISGSPRPSATSQPPATAPTTEPIRPMPDAQPTPVARLDAG